MLITYLESCEISVTVQVHIIFLHPLRRIVQFLQYSHTTDQIIVRNARKKGKMSSSQNNGTQKPVLGGVRPVARDKEVTPAVLHTRAF